MSWDRKQQMLWWGLMIAGIVLFLASVYISCPADRAPIQDLP